MTTVSFDTSAYVRSHGKTPRGWGCWGFFIDGNWREPWFAPYSMPYGEAKKVAAIETKRRCADAWAGHAGSPPAVVYVEVAP